MWAVAWTHASPVQADGLIEGIDGYAEAVTGRASAKWAGQRVDWPVPRVRPASVGRLDSFAAPISVHATSPANARRLPEVLSYAELTHALLAASGLFSLHGDGGQAATFQRDLYLADTRESGAALDATAPAWDVDGGRAFAVVDARAPSALLAPCVSQALIEAELFELDPAEAESVRKGSAAYFTTLLHGDSCPLAARETPDGALDTLHDPSAFASWLAALDGRQARGSGVFVENMWQFARQKTWEGAGLRGSPDLLEAIGKALELGHERLEEVAGDIALRMFQASTERTSVARVTWGQLPAHRPAVSPALLPLGVAYLLVALEQPRVGERLSVWSRGESPVRWVLSATRLDAQGKALATINAAVRKFPESELHVELDAQTHSVLISITNLGSGKVDADRPSNGLARSVRLIVDRAR